MYLGVLLVIFWRAVVDKWELFNVHTCCALDGNLIPCYPLLNWSSCPRPTYLAHQCSAQQWYISSIFHPDMYFAPMLHLPIIRGYNLKCKNHIKALVSFQLTDLAIIGNMFPMLKYLCKYNPLLIEFICGET